VKLIRELGDMAANDLTIIQQKLRDRLRL